MLLAVLALWSLLQDPKAVAAAQAALAKAEAASGTDSVEVSDAATILGNRLVDAGDYDAGIGVFERALRIRFEIFGDDHLKTRVALSNLANAWLAKCEPSPALPLLDRALASFERNRVEDASKVATLFTIGAAHRQLGQYRESRTVLERAVAVATEVCPDHPFAALARQGLATTLMDYGEIERARRLIEAALATAERDPKSRPCAHAVFGIGIALGNAGRFDEALPLLQRGLELVRQAFGVDSSKAMLSSAVLATMLWEAGRRTEAVTVATDLLALAGERGDVIRRARAQAHAVLSMAAVDAGDAPRALEQARRMVAVQDATSTTGRDLARQLLVLGRALVAAGDQDAAIAAFRRAIAMHEGDAAANGIGDGVGQVEVRCALAGVLAAKGDVAGAVGERQRALAAFRASVDRMLPAMLERQRLQTVQRHRGNLDALLVTAHDPAAAFPPAQQHAEVLLWKGQVARGLERSLASARQNPDTAAALARLQQLVREIGGDPNDKQVLRERQALSAMLGAAGSGLTEHQAVGRIAEWLAPTEALVDYLLITGADGVRRFVCFVVRPGRPTFRFDLAPHAAVQQAVATHVRVASRRTRPGLGGTSLAAAAARAVHELVWEPLSAALEGVTRVAISPDDVLAELPFETLPGVGADRFLVEDIEIAYLQNGLELEPVPAPAEAVRAFVVGDVDYGAQLGVGSERAAGETFAPLPGTRAELAALAELRGDTAMTLVSGAEATEQRLVAGVAGATFVHLATHGFCTGIANGGVTAGIALAFANRGCGGASHGDDGILTSDEAALLDLRGCRLVTLSACQSGLGTPVSGENLLGLRRSLHLAGARATLTSLWRVDDAATAASMADFYRALWRDGLSPSVAWRRVQLAQIAAQRAAGEVLPGVWGGFVVEGR